MYALNEELIKNEIITITEGTNRYTVPKKIWDQYWKNYNANGTTEVNPWNVPTYDELMTFVNLSAKKILVNEITELLKLQAIPVQEDLAKVLKFKISTKKVSMEFPDWISVRQLRTIAKTYKELHGFDYTVIKETQSSSENKIFWVLKANIVQVLYKFYLYEQIKPLLKSMGKNHVAINAPGFSPILGTKSIPPSGTTNQKNLEWLNEELISACHKGKLETVKHLIAAGANPEFIKSSQNYRYLSSTTPLITAAHAASYNFNRQKAILDYLIDDLKVNVNQADANGNTLAHKVANDIVTLRYLLPKGLDLLAQNHEGKYPINNALSPNHHHEEVDFLAHMMPAIPEKIARRLIDLNKFNGPEYNQMVASKSGHENLLKAIEQKRKNKMESIRLLQEKEETDIAQYKEQNKAKIVQLNKRYDIFIKDIIHVDLVQLRSFKINLEQEIVNTEKELESTCKELLITDNRIEHSIGKEDSFIPFLERNKSVLHSKYCLYKETLRIKTLMLDKIKAQGVILENQSIPAKNIDSEQSGTENVDETAPKTKNINLFFKHMSSPQIYSVSIKEEMPLRTMKDTFEESIQVPQGSLRYTLYGRTLPNEGTVGEWNQQSSAKIQDASTIQYNLALRGD